MGYMVRLHSLDVSRSFNPRYRFQIHKCAFIREWIKCPYLSVKIKRDGQSEDTAVAQSWSIGGWGGGRGGNGPRNDVVIMLK